MKAWINLYLLVTDRFQTSILNRAYLNLVWNLCYNLKIPLEFEKQMWTPLYTREALSIQLPTKLCGHIQHSTTLNGSGFRRVCVLKDLQCVQGNQNKETGMSRWKARRWAEAESPFTLSIESRRLSHLDLLPPPPTRPRARLCGLTPLPGQRAGLLSAGPGTGRKWLVFSRPQWLHSREWHHPYLPGLIDRLS